ncbi:MarR family winged helix-turn-helix transcriptional regulator [Galactobacter caseinivorans]|nr:MarR family transcriptional regulator [Galactobacter caseinivorans]
MAATPNSGASATPAASAAHPADQVDSDVCGPHGAAHRSTPMGPDPKAELTPHERGIFAVEQEFARMVAGARRSMRMRATMMHPDLLPFDFKVVGALWHHDQAATEVQGLTSREIAELLASDKSMVSRSLKRLDEVGFIRREADPRDARLQRIHPTTEAADSYRETGREQRREVQERLRTWDISQVEQLAQLLLKLNGPWPDPTGVEMSVDPPTAAPEPPTEAGTR